MEEALLEIDTPVYKISEAAEMLNISVHTLRMYEREGLIIPFRKDSKQRLFSQRDIERLKCIRRAINDEKISIEGIKRIYSLIPCFAIMSCSLSDREVCDAWGRHSKPCWLLNHINDFCSGRKCRLCVVYNNYGDCEIIKNKLKELLT